MISFPFDSKNERLWIPIEQIHYSKWKPFSWCDVFGLVLVFALPAALFTLCFNSTHVFHGLTLLTSSLHLNEELDVSFSLLHFHAWCVIYSFFLYFIILHILVSFALHRSKSLISKFNIKLLLIREGGFEILASCYMVIFFILSLIDVILLSRHPNHMFHIGLIVSMVVTCIVQAILIIAMVRCSFHFARHLSMQLYAPKERQSLIYPST